MLAVCERCCYGQNENTELQLFSQQIEQSTRRTEEAEMNLYRPGQATTCEGTAEYAEDEGGSDDATQLEHL